MKTLLILIVILASTVNLEAKMIDPAVWITQHGHRHLGKIAEKMMKIDFNIDLGKGKKKR